MATVTGLTAERMQELADAFIVDATVNTMGNLIVTTAGGTEIDAGPIILYGTSEQYYRGDKQWATLDKNAVGLSNVDNVSVRAEYIPKWLANMVYKAGSLVISPYGELVKAKTWHGSATYSHSNWASVISGEKVLTRGNYVLNPLAISSANGFATYQPGTGEAGTQTLVTGAVDGPIPEITTYARYSVTTAKTGGSSGWRAEVAAYYAPTNGASGDTRTLDVYLRYTGTGTLSVTPRLSFYNGSTLVNSGANGTTVVLQSGVWARLSASGVATGTFTNIGWWAFSTTGATAAVGSKVDATGALVSTFSAPFFSGATPKNAELEYGWNGAANNSASYEYSVSANAFVPKWQAGKTYAVGDQVVTPTNWVMSANAAHTSSAAFATDVAKWDGMGTTPYGHMGRTGGFQATGANVTVIMDAAQELRGGMTFDNANDALVVPVTGRYRAHLKGYLSGSTSSVNTVRIYVNGVIGDGTLRGGVYEKLISSTVKTDSADIYHHSMGVVPFNAGDKVSLGIYSAVSVWGTNGYNGAYLELEYVGGS
jgi:hypothetical protein